MYTVEETAELLKVKPTTIRKWLKEGKLQGTKVSNMWRISVDELKDKIVPGNFLFPGGRINVVGNNKLQETLYPEDCDNCCHDDARDNVLEEWESKLNNKFPYPFKPDEVAYFNQDKSDCLLGHDPESYNIYYSLKLKSEERKFEKLLQELKEKYAVDAETIEEIRNTNENLIVLAYSQYLHPGI